MPKPKVKDRPTIINDHQYEALRHEGMSKEKAARIANSDPKEMAAHRRNPGSSYEEWTRVELLDKAREVGIPGRSTMNKAELVDALRTG